MYHSKQSLQPLLPPQRFYDPAAHEEELRLLRQCSWQLVTTTETLRRSGDYWAGQVLGQPILVRNQDGRLLAFGNVCSHRHCQMLPDGLGHQDTIRCPYHGWHYGPDGLTRRLPKANLFPGFDREAYRLAGYQVETCGQLVFVCLDPRAGSLRDWLGSFYQPMVEATAPQHWRLNLTETRDCDANWKVLIEGSLESYHLDEIHSHTLGADPGEEQTEHQLLDEGSSFETSARGNGRPERLEEWSIRFLTGQFDPTYRHVHVYPNLMASYADSLSLIYQIVPLTAETSRMQVYGFGRLATKPGLLRRMWSFGMRRASARIAIKILDEDAAVFPQVQKGKHGAVNVGIFGRCEERLHSFEQYLTARLGELS